MMRNRQILIYLLLLSAAACAARGEDAFYRVALPDLKILEGKAPQPPRHRPSKWGYGRNPMMPYARLSGEGEVFIDFRIEWVTNWGQPPSFRTLVVARGPAGKDVHGQLFIPRPDWSGMERLTFEIPASAAGDHRKDFYAAKYEHYSQLVKSGLAGSAYFRREMEAAGKALGFEPRLDPRAKRADDMAGTFGFFSGSAAISENLNLDRVLNVAASDAGKETVNLADIRGITVRPVNWAPLIKDQKPASDPLAEMIPEDQHALFIPTFDAAMALVDEGNLLAGSALPLAEDRAEDAGVMARYQKQLGLSTTALSRMLGPKVIGSMAITGSDPYLRLGSDVAVIFEPKDAGALKTLLNTQIAVVAAASNAKPAAGEIEGIKYSGFVTDDRQFCSYMMELGPGIVVCNSIPQLRRLVEVKNGKTKSLRSLPEYTFFRTRYPRAHGDETALIIISDATIRRWGSPRWRIADSRRTRARAVMEVAGMDKLEDRLKGASGPLETRWTDAAAVSLQNGQVRSSIYGTRDFMTPISELQIDRVRDDEAAAYAKWRDDYERRWRVFDPIAIRLTAQQTRIGMDLTVMPLTLTSEYKWLIDIARGVSIGDLDGDRHGAGMHFAMSLNKDSSILKIAADWLAGMAKPLNLDLAWLGNSISIYLDDDPFWADWAKAEGSPEFMQHNAGRVPMGIQLESIDGLKLTAFVAGMRRGIDKMLPEMTVWEVVAHKVQPYGKISFTDKTRQWHLPEGMAIYYAALPDALVISLNEDVIQRALARCEARTTDRLQGKKPQPTTRPFIGANIAAQADGKFVEKYGLTLWPAYSHAMQAVAWGNIAILNEWKRLRPQEDPVALHEKLFGVKLVGPDGSGYAWNEKWGTMESASYGHPGEPKNGPRVPGILTGLKFISAGIDFEGDGLRARTILERN